jgi:predicted glycogen debranching enzyme
MSSARIDEQHEWLEADGLGGFASGTLNGVRTRRYHALLLPALTPPTNRVVLVNGFDAWIETAAGRWALSSQRYGLDVIHPDGASRIMAFQAQPWPRWRFGLPAGLEIEHEVFARHGTRAVAVTWRLLRPVADGADGNSAAPGAGRPGHPVRLVVRPFLSGRDFHATHHENPAFRFAAEAGPGRVAWQPYAGLPVIVATHNGEYTHEPLWYRNFAYAEERARGLDFTEDLASPGTLTFDLQEREAVCVLHAVTAASSPITADAAGWLKAARKAERLRRSRFASPLHRAADAYIVRRGAGRSIVAGYPWFADWGRDTFIALRGLCLVIGRLNDARAILLEWADAASDGMLPNRFGEQGEPEFNSVDASLWYVIAVHDYLARVGGDRRKLPLRDRRRLEHAVLAILEGYTRGTRHGIRADRDGLLAAGEPGMQLTWMDARVGDRVVTPRIGKPVEVQALWLNALAIGCAVDSSWQEPLRRGRCAFRQRFWNEARGCLHDVVDVDHVAGTADASLRPNQIFAVGGLPHTLLEDERARAVVDVVERHLLTPLGLRSLAPGEPGYTPRYEGGVLERDGAYHQGTVWPWLMGPFVESWLRVHGDTAETRDTARRRFLQPLLAHLQEAGIGHVSEIADAAPPHTPRGCPFQAWSLGELLRITDMVNR